LADFEIIPIEALLKNSQTVQWCNTVLNCKRKLQKIVKKLARLFAYIYIFFLLWLKSMFNLKTTAAFPIKLTQQIKSV
jgi:hypothetical protein